MNLWKKYKVWEMQISLPKTSSEISSLSPAANIWRLYMEKLNVQSCWHGVTGLPRSRRGRRKSLGMQWLNSLQKYLLSPARGRWLLLMSRKAIPGKEENSHRSTKQSIRVYLPRGHKRLSLPGWSSSSMSERLIAAELAMKRKSPWSD